MTTFSQTDLATRVLRDLGLVESEETPSDVDIAFALETISSETASMGVRGVPIMNGSDESIPLEYLTALSRRIGLAVAPAFGLITIADAARAIPEAESLLSELSLTRAEPLTLTTPGIVGGDRAGTYSWPS